MPSITSVVRRFTKQTMIYWEKIGSDKYGKPIYGTPVELKVRWEAREIQELETGERIVPYGVRLLLSNPVVSGSLVWLGTIAEWEALPYYPNLPTVNQGGREIMGVNTTPDLKAQGFVYEAVGGGSSR